jgi:glutamate racemase
MLSGLIQLVMGEGVVLVSSAEETAKDVYSALTHGDQLREDADAPHHTFLTTGDAERFRELAEVFLGGHELAAVEAVHVHTGGAR